MKKKVDSKKYLSELRIRAEKLIAQKSVVIQKEESQNNIMELLHELQVRQLELEMQNDELQITHHKLEESNSKFTYLFEHAPVAYFIVDMNGVILDLNYTGSNQMGIEKKQLIGKPFSIYINSIEAQDKFYLHRNSVYENDEPQQMECEVKRKNSSVFSALIKTAIVKEENSDFKYFLLTITDISELKEQKKKIEQALVKEQELNKFKSDFITLTSHEFRTPLAVILTSSELVEAYIPLNETEKQYNQISKIKKAVFRLKEIVSDFLSVKELESKTIINNPSDFNYVELITELIESTEAEFKEHTILFTNTGRLENVFLDKKLFKICLNNVFSNAVKYSYPNEVIHVKANVNKAKELFTVSVSNRGIGIPKTDALKIFEPFYRLKSSESIQGLGMGLDIVKRLTNIMGGKVSFTSEENKTTTFVLTFLLN